MSEDRKAWAKRVLDRDTHLATLLKEFRAHLGASVTKMEHRDNALSLGADLPWQSDLSVIANAPFRLKK